MLRSTTPPCPHHVPDNFITFHFRAPGRNHIVSVPFEAMEFPCLVNEHWDSSCPLQFCLGHKQAHTQAQTHFSFFIFSSCCLSALFLFCDHAVQKKKTQLYQISFEYRDAYCHFLTEQQWKRTSVHFPLYSFLK